MTIAVLRNNGDLIWFDAILQFSEKYTGQVSSHPLESGNVISDHTVINNLTMTLQGIISDADFNMTRPTITDSDAENWHISNKQFVNNSPVEDAVVIKYKPGVSSYLPDSIAQFITPASPVVEVPMNNRPMAALGIKDRLTQMQRLAETFSLVDFHGNKIWRVLDNCVITSLDFTEVAEAGEAIFPNMTIEQCRFATTITAKIPKVVNKGRKGTTKKTREEKKGDDPVEEPTAHAGTSGSDLLKGQQKYEGGS
ncbi:hypothetical protein phiK7A1_081 [Pseudomonas phage phiK7A1]|uniref:Dit-like phage tail protein N-terminal domain-containing protein n=1 Tax=Pseudomonas phage phiK7A1 TaxID=2759194 RepID=A0A7H0XFS9_9CAUD|nr:hypothetical protein phiK7A1_081 [Pseudomonas phage phiK7A1]